MSVTRVCTLAVILISAGASGASAQGVLPSLYDVAKTGSWANFPNTWAVTLGIEGRSSPSFYGASTSVFDPVPVFSLRPEGKAARFRSTRDSSSIALFQSNGFYFGVA